MTDPSQAFMSIKSGNELGKIKSCLGWASAVLVVLFHLDRNLNQTNWRRHFKTI